jgi:NADPH-dependent 2,4-dienoyl-CoA reductase/sulfur reductase-like enzyme
VLFDEQAGIGGQIYRAIEETPLTDPRVLGASYWRGQELARAFRASGAQYVPEATVWNLTPEHEIGVSLDGGAVITTARCIILCTGALERPFPIPGWTLPGVMSAGAAQILLKSSGLIPAGRTVLAGCGPLLWLVAWQFLNAGAKVAALLDTTPAENRTRALPHALPFLFSGYVRDGTKLLHAVKREVPVLASITSLSAIGENKVTHVEYRRGNGAGQRLEVDNLLLHQGIAPNVNLAMAAGVEHRWNDEQLCWAPVIDEYGNTSVGGIAIAGDGAGIAGAEAAEWRGRLAAIAATLVLGRSVADGEEAHARSKLAQCLRGRAFLDALYRPAPGFRRPAGDTVVCRCEEVTADQIADAVALGCPGPNQMKIFLRCGMGPCQGRLCGLTVTELIAHHRGIPPDEVGYYRLRPPVKPITVGELAALPKTAAAVYAVTRM